MTSLPRISVVTISYNQGKFLERTLQSVLNQGYPNLEYIVVDPGSTDHSREIIASYSSRLSKIILEPDSGPADGLNKGFALATGAIFGYLNSDDEYCDGALRDVADLLCSRTDLDGVSGHCYVIDENGRRLRKAFSDNHDLLRIAHNASSIIQPSTFFRAEIFKRSGGFNPKNRRNWDGELMVDMLLAGGKFAIADKYWSRFRLHEEGITATGKNRALRDEWQLRRFEKIVGRKKHAQDQIWDSLYRIEKHVRSPRGLIQRLLHGPVVNRLKGRTEK